MLGAVGAFACFAACTGTGLMARSRCADRAAALMGWLDALGAMGLLLEEERLPLGELLEESARAVDGHGASGQVRGRLCHAAKALGDAPSLTLEEAYEAARKTHPLSCEQGEEQNLLALLFRQLGNGSAAMRGQAVAACGRRMQALAEKAQAKADDKGKLYAQLGVLGGLVLAIALW